MVDVVDVVDEGWGETYRLSPSTILSNMTISAPLDNNWIFPSGVRTTTDMRRRKEENSNVANSSYVTSTPGERVR